MIGAALLAILLAGPAEDARIQQQDVVEQAAAAVAAARADGARRRDVADLMARYRQEAEALAQMEPPALAMDEAEVRNAAQRMLADATANGWTDPAARKVLADWLGPLGSRLGVLRGALAATSTTAERSPELARSMAQDIDAQSTALMLAAAYDATEATTTARSERLHAAALRQGGLPMQNGNMAAELDAEAADSAATRAEADAAALWKLRAEASDLRDSTRHLLEDSAP